MIPLRQSTAGQIILLGPMKSSTDFVTNMTGLVINNTDIRLSKSGGTFAAKSSGGATHRELGWYAATLNATDTNTVGTLDIVVEMPTALQVFVTCQVFDESVFDALYPAGATLATMLAVLNSFSFDASGFVQADTRRMNDAPVLGTGVTGDKWRGS